MWLRIALLSLAGVVGIGLVILALLPRLLQGRMNPVLQPPPYAVTREAVELHKRLVVVALHADAPPVES